MTHTELKAKGWIEIENMVFQKDFFKIVFEESSKKGKYGWLLIDELNKCFVCFKDTVTECIQESEKYLQAIS